MVTQSQLVGGGICCMVLNMILLVILIGIEVSRIPHRERKENLNVHKNEDVIKQEIGDLERSSKESQADISRVRQDLAAIYEREGNLKKPAIHLAITNSINQTDNDVPVLSWRHLSHTTVNGDVLHDGCAVTVTNGGFYYIYSSIRYRGEGTQELDYGRILHSVIMEKESETEESPTVLMQNLQSTPTIRRGRLAYTTSSLGATFYLAPKTKVMVTSSIPMNIDKSSAGTYFGLFLV